MEAYEIHVIKSANESTTHYDAFLSSDYAAIRRAKSLAEHADVVEVWRRGCCIFSYGSSKIDVSKSDIEATQSQARQKSR